MPIKPFLTTSVIAIITGFILDTVGMFLPWLLGPLFGLLVFKSYYKGPLYWPTYLRNIGLVVLGVQLGSSFTKDAATLMVTQLPIMLLTTVLVIGFSIGTFYLLKKWTNISYSTALLGSFPGGLSQMVILSEEMKDADEAVVAFMQTIRIMMVITVVPFLVLHVVVKESQVAPVAAAADSFLLPQIDTTALLWMLIGMPLLIWGASKIKMPIPYLLVPILFVSTLNVIGYPQPILPPSWIDGAQLLFGAHLGVRMKINKEQFTLKMLSIVFVSNLCLITFCILLAEGLYAIFKLPFNDMFLSTAPGGVAEMAVTALAVNADVATVTSFHLFRIFTILLVVTPFMKWWMVDRKLHKKKSLKAS